MADGIMAQIVMANIVMVCIGMAHIGMARIVMAHTVMANIVMVRIVKWHGVHRQALKDLCLSTIARRYGRLGELVSRIVVCMNMFIKQKKKRVSDCRKRARLCAAACALLCPWPYSYHLFTADAVMAYLAMACVVLAQIVVAYAVMDYAVMAQIIMAQIVVAYAVMDYAVMAHITMAQIGMACVVLT